MTASQCCSTKHKFNVNLSSFYGDTSLDVYTLDYPYSFTHTIIPYSDY